MSDDLLFDIPPTIPRWQELRDRHGIRVGGVAPHYESDDGWIASYCDGAGFGATMQCAEQRDAVVTLLHKLQLDGWREVSICYDAAREMRYR